MRAVLVAGALALAAPLAVADSPDKPFEPYVGQPGKDVIWVPTPEALVEKMLDMARLTPADFVIDLGSGDGRNVIAAARRGARALGIEYNADMVALSRRNAEKAGVADRARFEQGDMFEADISKADVMPLFLLPSNLERLKPKFLALKPGTRIVTNGYEIDGWEHDEVGRISPCSSWCTAYLYVIPARVAGRWELDDGRLELTQEYRRLSGTLVANGRRLPIENAQLKGDRIAFTAGLNRYEGRVSGNTMSGKVSGSRNGHWKARRA